MRAHRRRHEILAQGLVGEIDSRRRRGGGTNSALAQAAITELGARGADGIHNLVGIEDDEVQAFWQAQGFERDMIQRRQDHRVEEVRGPRHSPGIPREQGCPVALVLPPSLANHNHFGGE